MELPTGRTIDTIIEERRSLRLYKLRPAIAYSAKGRRPENRTVSEYKRLLQNWKELGAEIRMNSYETDKKQKLHIHGWMTIPSHVKYKAFQDPEFSIRTRRMHTNEDIDIWEAYCQKDQDMQTDTDDKVPRKSLFLR